MNLMTMPHHISLLCVLLIATTTVLAWDNGLALTPPMGWLAWERFRCNVDCDNDPDFCLRDKLFMIMADLIASQGYKEAGYNIVSLDECWTAPTRDNEGRLQPDAKRFPNGLKALGDYIHSRGLKFGVYTDYGTKTCNNEYPGSEFYEQLDAQTFADWGADYVKLDGCNFPPEQWQQQFPPFNFFLNKTGRPMVLSTEFPFYMIYLKNLTVDYKAVSKVCNLARNHMDIDDSWDSMMTIINFYGDNRDDFASAAGPGYWNDPDMLIIGNFGLSYDQERVQMAMWSIFAAPLLMSVDLRTIRPRSKELLLNRRAIVINQDPLGIQGRRTHVDGNIQVWTRPLKGSARNGASPYAFAILNVGTDGTPSKVDLPLTLTIPKGYNVNIRYNITEVFDGNFMGIFTPTQSITVFVNPTGVYFGRADPL